MATRARLAAAGLAMTLLLATDASCTSGPDGNPSSSPAASTITPQPTPTTATPTVTPSSPTSQPPPPGHAEVVALVKRYYAVDDAVARDRSVPVSRYKEVAAGQWSKTIRAYSAASRRRGEQVKGQTKISEPKVTSLSPAEQPTAAKATVCLDVSKVKVFDKQGKSIVPKNRPDFYVERLVVRKQSNGWRVYDIRNKGVAKC